MSNRNFMETAGWVVALAFLFKFRVWIIASVTIIIGIIVTDCMYENSTGRSFLTDTEIEVKEKEEAEAQFWAKVEQEETAKLTRKMNAGDLNAQTEYAEDFLYNDDPSDDEKGMQLLADAAGKDCAKAQDSFARILWKQGHKEQARDLWLRAARGREERKWGTGSHKARYAIKYHFPSDYDPKWDED
jgi:hypothetical protein